jgi:hypothetical protein
MVSALVNQNPKPMIKCLSEFLQPYRCGVNGGNLMLLAVRRFRGR